MKESDIPHPDSQFDEDATVAKSLEAVQELMRVFPNMDSVWVAENLVLNPVRLALNTQMDRVRDRVLKALTRDDKSKVREPHDLWN